MISLEIALTANFIAKLIIFLIYSYLYFQYKENFIGYWTLAWGCFFIKSIFDPFLLNSTLVFILVFVLANAAVLFYAWGSWSFIGKKLPKSLIIVVLINFLIICIGGSFNYSLTFLLIPFAFIFALIHIITGIFLLRNRKIPVLSLKIAAYALIMNGINQLTFPIFQDTFLLNLGFLCDSILRFLIAFGFLFAYFDKIKSDLETKDAQMRFWAEETDIVYRYQTVPIPKFEYISPNIINLTGYSQNEYYNDPFLFAKLIHPDDVSMLDRYGQPFINNKPLVIKIVSKDQSLQWVELYTVSGGTPLRGIEYIDCILKDITLEKQVEYEILRLDRLNIASQKAGPFVRDLKNSLTVLDGYLQVLAQKKDMMSVKRIINIMREETTRADLMLNEYLSLARERPSILRPANLNDIINELLPALKIRATDNNQVLVTRLHDLPPVLLDKNEIRQVILNLVNNGFEAMQPNKSLVIHTFVKNGEAVLVVEDEGAGISPENLSKIGIPFFTTKKFSKGLGLTVCYAIAAHHGAVLDISSVPGKTAASLRFKPYRQNNLVILHPQT